MTSLAGLMGTRARLVAVLGLSVTLIVSGLAPAVAQPSLQERRDAREEAERREAELRQQREQAEGDEAEAEADLETALDRQAELEAERDRAEERLAELEERFERAARAYDEARTELDALEARIEELEASIESLQEAVAEREEQVGHLLRGLYKTGGQARALETVLRSKAISDTTRRIGYVRSAQRHQRGLIDAFLAERRTLERDQFDLVDARERQAEVAAELGKRRQELEERFAEQEREVDGLLDTVAGAEEQLAEIEVVVAAAADRVAALRGEEENAGREVAQRREAERAEEARLEAERRERERREREEAERREREERQRQQAAREQEEREEREARQARREREAAEQAQQEREAAEREERRQAAAAAERERERQREREREVARASEERASRSSGQSSGGVACPVGRPRSYSDTYGAPRSGGRSHQGTDILAPMATPIYAYESGTISRMSNNRLGGITLYLQGDSGRRYYYAHLQRYSSGLSTGQRVTAGQQIAYNGDTGNAGGIPHLHIEVFVSGSNVNPYPYMRDACG